MERDIRKWSSCFNIARPSFNTASPSRSHSRHQNCLQLWIPLLWVNDFQNAHPSALPHSTPKPATDYRKTYVPTHPSLSPAKRTAHVYLHIFFFKKMFFFPSRKFYFFLVSLPSMRLTWGCRILDGSCGTRVAGRKKNTLVLSVRKGVRTWGNEEVERLRKSLSGKLKKTKQQDACEWRISFSWLKNKNKKK